MVKYHSKNTVHKKNSNIKQGAKHSVLLEGIDPSIGKLMARASVQKVQYAVPSVHSKRVFLPVSETPQNAEFHTVVFRKKEKNLIYMVCFLHSLFPEEAQQN